MTTLYSFTSDGTHLPAGQYLVTVWDEAGDSPPQLAWRPEPRAAVIWGPPVLGEELGS